MKETEGYIIFVDDDREEHHLFRIALGEVSASKVLSAYNGEEALELISQHADRIFAIISDISMPKLSGFELKRSIDQNPELKLKAIPFIFHSSSTEPALVKEAYALGIQGFIEKSGDIQQTINALRHFTSFWALTVHPSIYRRHINFRK